MRVHVAHIPTRLGLRNNNEQQEKRALAEQPWQELVVYGHKG